MGQRLSTLPTAYQAGIAVAFGAAALYLMLPSGRHKSLPPQDPVAHTLKTPRPTEHGLDKLQVTLYYIKPYNGEVHGSVSPFCYKTELFLRATKIPFRIERGAIFGAPKKKVPYAKLGKDITLCDSADIIEYLTRVHSKRIKDGKLGSLLLDEALPRSVAAQHHLARRTLEEHVNFCANAMIFGTERGFAHVLRRSEEINEVPWPFTSMVANFIRSAIVDSTHAQGVSRHCAELIAHRLAEDIDAIGRLHKDIKLPGGPFFGGTHVTVLDCVAVGFLHGMYADGVPGPVDGGVGGEKTKEEDVDDASSAATGRDRRGRRGSRGGGDPDRLGGDNSRAGSAGGSRAGAPGFETDHLGFLPQGGKSTPDERERHAWALVVEALDRNKNLEKLVRAAHETFMLEPVPSASGGGDMGNASDGR